MTYNKNGLLNGNKMTINVCYEMARIQNDQLPAYSTLLLVSQRKSFHGNSHFIYLELLSLLL